MLDPVPTSVLTAKLQRFAELVRASEHNLVSKRARDELQRRHIPECVAFASLLPSGGGRVLDLGSGGGFPGLVVALCRPELEVHLLDATAKKTDFLRDVAAELDVPVTVHTGRAEQLARQDALAAAFDLVTARAVAPLERLVGWSMPFLRDGGLLCAIKGQRWSVELEAARSIMARSGAAVVATPDDASGRDGDQDVDGVAGPAPRVVMIARVR